MYTTSIVYVYSVAKGRSKSTQNVVGVIVVVVVVAAATTAASNIIGSEGKQRWLDRNEVGRHRIEMRAEWGWRGMGEPLL